MNISDAAAWYAALAFGSIVVGIFSWSRFDEPSYDDKSQYFRIYAPRFSTRASQYRKARLGYIAVIIAIFVFFSLFPKFIVVFATDEFSGKADKQLQGSALPLFVATLLIGFQHVPGLKQLEVKVRSVLHAFGNIPSGVRRTVSQLKAAPFNYKDDGQLLHVEVTRLASAINDDKLTTDIAKNDPVLRRWCKIKCIQGHLKEKARTRIDPSFFDTYKEELDSINIQQDALFNLVRLYAAQLMKSIHRNIENPQGSISSYEENSGETGDLNTKLGRLRDGIYTFIACGVRSSLESENAVIGALLAFGFDVHEARRIGTGFKTIAGLFLLAVIAITAFTVFASMQFNTEYVTGREWEASLGSVLPVPQNPTILLLWTFFSAAFYLAAVTGALLLRAVAISKFEWFDLNQLERERPIARYIGPVIFGSLCGYMTLCMINLIMLTAKAPSLGGAVFLGYIFESMRLSLYWVPIVVIVSFSSLWISDADFTRDNWLRKFMRILVPVLALTFIGWMISNMSSQLEGRSLVDHTKTSESILKEFETARSRASIMVGAFIALLTGMLMTIIQREERKLQNRDNITGKVLLIRGNYGGLCELKLAEDGAVHIPNSERNEVKTAGKWARYPEGYVINWNGKLKFGAHYIENCSVLLREGDTLMLEEHVPGHDREPEYAASVELKPSGVTFNDTIASEGAR